MTGAALLKTSAVGGGVLIELSGVETDPIFSRRRAHEFAGVEPPQPSLVGFPEGRRWLKVLLRLPRASVT